jgi:hypothetical protein
LIVGSWFNIVSPTVGWVGFGIAGGATLVSYILQSRVGSKREDYVYLDSRLLNFKDDLYMNAMARFTNGAMLMYDGVAFGFRPGNEIACAVPASSPNADEAHAREIADHAQSVFETLKSASPEFATAVAGQTFRISILSSMDPDATEIYRVREGDIESRR